MKLVNVCMVGAICAGLWATIAFVVCLIFPAIPAGFIVGVAGGAFIGGASYAALFQGGRNEKA